MSMSIRRASSNCLERAVMRGHASRRDECGPQDRGEETMKQIAITLAASTLLFGTVAANAQAPSWSPPAENQRCPSKWGAGDERGAVNHQKPQAVLNAAKLIKTGEVIEL